MAVYKIAVVVAVLFVLTEAQRPFYAGLRPIGYPDAGSDPLANRFGEDAGLPIEARGDGNLINRLNRLPADKQPFWYVNSRQYDALRKDQKTWPLKPNNFIGN